MYFINLIIFYGKRNIQDLLGIISNDKRIDGNDKIAIQDLVSLCETEQESCKQDTKKEMARLLKESLQNGYTVKNESDYLVFEKILKIIEPNYLIPSYDDIKNTLKSKENKAYQDMFSIVYVSERHIIQIYAIEKTNFLETKEWWSLFVQFSLVNSQSIERNWMDYFNMGDDFRNNNQINF